MFDPSIPKDKNKIVETALAVGMLQANNLSGDAEKSTKRQLDARLREMCETHYNLNFTVIPIMIVV